jgi:LysM repeat protein
MRMNMKIYPFLLACLLSLVAGAQQTLEVKGKFPDIYVLYVSTGTETLQTVSNQFGFSVAKLSTFNAVNINPAAVLPRGTAIKIPLSPNNLLQQPSENSAPVVHVIKKSDNLYRLSNQYNKIPLARLREWNKLKNDVVKSGQEVIIGYMVNAKPVAATADKKLVAVKETPPPVTAPATVVEEAPQKAAEQKQITASPVVVKKDTPVSQPILIREKSKPAEEKKTVAAEKKPEPTTEIDYTPKEGDEGYFAAGYMEHDKAAIQQFRSGDAATFKTISGWTDRKYYVLMNEIAPKTIVRITGPGKKSVCAMVLGPLQETKGALGVLLRISNSAASALGITDQKFTVTVTYFE